MAQIWDPNTYAENGSFVYGLAGEVLEWLDPRPAESILDLCCGDGQLTQRIAASGAHVRGLDLSPQMAASARSRGIEVDEGTAESLPYPHASFDAVFSNAALHWVRDQDAMLAEVYRVLKPSGRFVAEMGGQGNIAAIRVALMAVMSRHGYDGREDNVNYYPTPDAYTHRLERCGFHVERIALIPRPTPLSQSGPKSGPKSGMAGWINTFRRGVLDTLPEPMREVVVQESVALLAPVLRDEAGNWTADYVRLRFIARR